MEKSNIEPHTISRNVIIDNIINNKITVIVENRKPTSDPYSSLGAINGSIKKLLETRYEFAKLYLQQTEETNRENTWDIILIINIELKKLLGV